MELPILDHFVLALWATAVSWIEERSGLYQRLQPQWKQLVNALIVALVPALVGWTSGVWKPEFGSADGVFSALLLLLAPWLYSQVAHYLDLYLKKQTG